MTIAEFEDWKVFYAQQPFDDLHRYHRPAALVAAAMGGELQKKLDWLAPPQAPESDLNTMRAFGFTGPPRRI